VCREGVEIMGNFINEYLGHYVQSDWEKELEKIGKEYFSRTDSYDEIICSGIGPDGEAMPIDAHEHLLINKNALIVRRDIIARYNISPEIFKEAIAYVQATNGNNNKRPVP
jgi:hypothetical protein